MAKQMPKPGGHRKPGPAAKAAPEGYDHMKACPTCQGSGKVASGSAHQIALGRV